MAALGKPRSVLPIVAEAYDRLAPKWDEMYVDARAQAENKYVFGLIRKLGLHHGKVLDVGGRMVSR